VRLKSFRGWNLIRHPFSFTSHWNSCWHSKLNSDSRQITIGSANDEQHFLPCCSVTAILINYIWSASKIENSFKHQAFCDELDFCSVSETEWTESKVLEGFIKEINSCPANIGIYFTEGTRRLHYCVRLPLVILSQIIPLHNLPYYFFVKHFGISLLFNTLRTGLLNCLNARSRGLTFRHRASCI